MEKQPVLSERCEGIGPWDEDVGETFKFSRFMAKK
jgi:hypothetical protein